MWVQGPATLLGFSPISLPTWPGGAWSAFAELQQFEAALAALPHGSCWGGSLLLPLGSGSKSTSPGAEAGSPRPCPAQGDVWGTGAAVLALQQEQSVPGLCPWLPCSCCPPALRAAEFHWAVPTPLLALLLEEQGAKYGDRPCRGTTSFSC